MKKTSYFLVIFLALAGVCFFAINSESKKDDGNNAVGNLKVNDNQENKLKDFAFPGILLDEKIMNKKVVMTTDKGVIEFELYGDKAPKTVSNFVYLTEKGYYDGLTFHRVVPNFVIQGGDPIGNGTGGPGYKFPDETVQGDYLEGTVAMANSGADTNGSQFFICLEDLPTLPKSYNLFGQVTSGMDVVKKITIGDKMTSVKIENK